MNTESDQSNDPKLRSDLKRMFGQEKAPAALRGRMEALFRSQAGQAGGGMRLVSTATLANESQSSHSVGSYRMAHWFRPLMGLAAAAIFLIAFATLTYWKFASATRLDRGVLASLVSAHDARLRDQQSVSRRTGKNIREAAAAMGRELHGTILAPDLADENWVFQDAAVCTVGGKKGAQFLFTRGGQTMSVFSLPDPPCSAPGESGIDKEAIDGHMVAGFASNGRIFCMVGHCPKQRLDLDEVATLLEKHSTEMVSDAVAVARW